jgi:hypothetical protein
MSHFTEMKSKALVKNEGDLVAALKTQFGEEFVEVHDTPQKLNGYDAAANKKAHIIIRKGAVNKALGTHGWNDIGLERLADGTYSMHYDPADMQESTRQKIFQDYAERVASRKLKAQGYTLKRSVAQNGHVVIKATKYE